MIGYNFYHLFYSYIYVFHHVSNTVTIIEGKKLKDRNKGSRLYDIAAGEVITTRYILASLLASKCNHPYNIARLHCYILRSSIIIITIILYREMQIINGASLTVLDSLIVRIALKTFES